MKEQLLSLANYLDSLEQRIAALECANTALQDTISAQQNTINALQDKLDNLEPQAPLEPQIPIEPQAPLEPIEPLGDLGTLENPIPTPAPEPEPTPEPAPQPTSPLQRGLGGVSPSAQLGSVSNIRQAISLGDRFLFQRELFANNGELMQKTLDELDACANLGEAEQFITRFNWDPESTTYKLFLNVLKRRF